MPKTRYIEFDTSLLTDWMKRSGLSAMDLVRQCKVSVSIAYKLAKGEPIGDLNTIYKIYTSLKESGRSVTWKELTGIE